MKNLENDSTSGTEIEAKYIIRDRETFESLKSVTRIGRFNLVDGHDVFFTDYFLDTPDKKIDKAGYYFRERHETGAPEVSFTLKETGSVSGSVHRREETIEKCPAGSRPDDIKNPEFRRKLLTLSGNLPLNDLKPVFTMKQKRVFCDFRDGEELIAVLSFDEVIVSGKEEKDPDLSFFELEIELAGGGREAHLDEADRIILEKFGEGKILPANLSKYGRARFMTEEEL